MVCVMVSYTLHATSNQTIHVLRDRDSMLYLRYLYKSGMVVYEIFLSNSFGSMGKTRRESVSTKTAKVQTTRFVCVISGDSMNTINMCV